MGERGERVEPLRSGSRRITLARARNLKPTEGARFVLERHVDPTPKRASEPSIDVANDGATSDHATSASGDDGATSDHATSASNGDAALNTRATYRASIHTPDGEFATTATLAEDGTVVLAGSTGAPGDLDERLKNIAKLVARDAPKRRDDGLVVWPARIMRWRK